MSEQPISPLRRRMIEDMSVRNFVENTRNDYIRHVRTFTAFLGRSPDTATPEDLRRFQLHQTQTGVRPPSINGSVAALRFFFTVTLDRPEMARHLTFVREPRKIPVVLNPEEVARLLEAAPGPKYKATERRLRCGSARLRGGGAEGIARPAVWLFPGRDPMLPMTTRQFNRAVHLAAGVAEIKKRVTPHTLRHSFAARAEHRHPPDPGSARACQARHHRALHAGGHQRDPRGDEPARSAHAADRQEGRPARLI
jgi:site-specific recombinase XerD